MRILCTFSWYINVWFRVLVVGSVRMDCIWVARKWPYHILRLVTSSWLLGEGEAVNSVSITGVMRISHNWANAERVTEGQWTYSFGIEPWKHQMWFLKLFLFYRLHLACNGFRGLSIVHLASIQFILHPHCHVDEYLLEMENRSLQ